MIHVRADYSYNCDTKTEVEWVISNLPPETQYTVDWLTKTVKYHVTQSTEQPK